MKFIVLLTEFESCLLLGSNFKDFMIECFYISAMKPNRKVACDVTDFAPKKWMTKSYNLCWRGIGRTPTFRVILKNNEKLIKIWNELLLVGFSERNKFDNKQFG